MSQHLKKVTLEKVPEEQAFRVCRGDVITNVHDLANCVESLSEEEFRHHVSADHNHFADWVEGALKNPGLAEDLRYEVNVKDKAHFVKTIRDHVDWLDKF